MELFIILLVPMAILYFWYVAIISRRNATQETNSGIDVQLKKRTDLIPNILRLASKFMSHEKSLLEEITQLRTKVLESREVTNDGTNDSTVEDKFSLENRLHEKLSSLMVSVENYPELKSDSTMLEAQRVYADVEEHISAARRNYNASTKSLLNAIQIFPGNIIASLIGVNAPPFFEVNEIERTPVNADDYLK